MLHMRKPPDYILADPFDAHRSDALKLEEAAQYDPVHNGTIRLCEPRPDSEEIRSNTVQSPARVTVNLI